MIATWMLLGALVAPDTALAARADTASPSLVPPAIAHDTVPRRRPRVVEVSDAYEMRLRIHRYGSYTLIPLFALQTVAGNQLYQSDVAPAGWKSAHKVGAAGLGVLFTVNTVTGVWNLWEGREAEQGRTKRLLHSALMLASDAGFTYAGVKLSEDATRSLDGRRRHRNMAYLSIGTALVGYGVMLFGDH